MLQSCDIHREKPLHELRFSLAIVKFALHIFVFIYFETLLSIAYTFKINTSSWGIEIII